MNTKFIDQKHQFRVIEHKFKDFKHKFKAHKHKIITIEKK